MTGLRFAALTHPGFQRQGNEDAILALALPGRPEKLLAVADGLGGLAQGALASSHTLRRVRLAALGCEQPDLLTCLADALETANRELVEHAGGDPTRAMGTTIVGIIAGDDAFRVFHAGDSRAYLLRGGELERLTVDHSVVAEQVAAGLMTDEEADESPHRNQVTRCVGVDPPFELDVTGGLPFEPGDRLLVCSDGLSGPVRDNRIAEILADGEAPLPVARRLIQAALDAGGPDNISVAVGIAGA